MSERHERTTSAAWLAVLMVLGASLGACTDAPPATSGASRQAHDPSGTSPFIWRGVVEGYYGPPWAVEDRFDLLDWMIGHDFNIYIHAPKNDVYQRLRWRAPYPQELMAQFAEEIRRFTPRGLAWVPSISPAMPLLEAADEHDEDICFSCPGDFELLLDKFEPFWQAGSRVLMISFDDVVKVSSHPQDAEAYGVGEYAYGVMNADLLNRLYDHYSARDPGFVLYTVPADYFGPATTPYLEGLRSALRPEVEVMWTGVQVYSPSIGCLEADGFAAAIGRKPVLWDNSHVNDAMSYKLMVGPYDGRAPDLPDCLRGIVINPSPQAQADKLALASVQRYLADPEGYDPEAAWRYAVRDFAGSEAAEAMLNPFIQNVRSTHMNRTEAVLYGELVDGFVAALSGEDWPAAFDALQAELELELATPERLRQSFPNARAVDEFDTVLPLRSAERRATDSWLTQLQVNARKSLTATAALARTRAAIEAEAGGSRICGRVLAPADPQELGTLLEDVGQGRFESSGGELPNVNVHGDRFFFALGPTAVLENKVDAFMNTSMATLAAYAPLAAAASRSVTLAADGEPVAPDTDGFFCVDRRPPVELRAVDALGRATRRVVAR